MSMNLSEFRRRLGAEPRSKADEMRRAREASEAHRAVAREADRLEHRLERALDVPVPKDLVDSLRAIPSTEARPRRWWPVALAASLLLAVGAAGVGLRVSNEWASVQDYVMDHYRHDGERLVAESLQDGYGDVHEVLAKFGLDAEPALANIVGLVKLCPSPKGKGVHMVLHTDQGPLTVMYMPDTHVHDGESWAFESKNVVLVDLPNGSAAIIGAQDTPLRDYYAMLHDALVTLPGPS